ncbi:MAG: ATP-binding cassette domain-containing protein [Candidatus Cloacimonetes bacterium]|jgi:phospholipid/cholesterol/gamma-HCH transport system ATP-binding protein|nr:ATP-binding cassette domain-containing protein [Candidatus Cloacimonadota bacterium]
MIEIKNLSISFSDQEILKNINFTISENKITIIVGQSGTGKSVLMKCIEGLIEPDEGSIIIDEKNIYTLNKPELNEIRKKMAMLFQGSALLDSLNVYQNVALPLIEHTELSEAEILEEVTDKLELVGLKDVLTKMPSELSGGMKKRVALARAIILKPKYIIYDEPTTGLDPIIANEISNLILKLQDQYNIASIIITHDMDCIRKIKGHIMMIHEKKIVFDGTYSDFITDERKIIKGFVN